MYNLNLLKERLGVYKKRGNSITVNDAISQIEQKFVEISRTLGIPKTYLYTIDANGVPFFGHKPSILYKADPTPLKKVLPVNIPIAFFITGDAIDTRNLNLINRKLKIFNNLSMPNAHKFAQSLICKTLLDHPVYTKNKPLIPLGIDNYVFASPEDVVNRLKVIKEYKKVVGKNGLTKSPEFRRTIVNTFYKNARKKFRANRELIKEFIRIFPNALNTVFSIEPPSAAVGLSEILADDKPLAVVQLEYFVHPGYFGFANKYYLYLSDDPRNRGLKFPRVSRKNLLVGPIPLERGFLDIPKPRKKLIKNVFVASGGAAGRTLTMAKQLSGLNYKQSLRIFMLTGLFKNSEEFRRLKTQFTSNTNLKFLLLPKIDTKSVKRLLKKTDVSIIFPGTFSLLEGMASGRPIGAVIDTRKGKDKIFTDHVKGNAYFARDVIKYPVVIIKDKIEGKHLDILLGDSYRTKAYEKAIVRGGVRDMLKNAERKWRDVFVYFLK